VRLGQCCRRMHLQADRRPHHRVDAGRQLRSPSRTRSVRWKRRNRRRMCGRVRSRSR
jgi:hypothetical protein